MKTRDAVGQMLCQDITQIIPGKFKGPVFRKGHIITEEDIPVLLSIGKENIYIWETDETMMHENDAAMALYEICCGQSPLDKQEGGKFVPSEIKEGKIELIAGMDGLLKVNRQKLRAINGIGQMMIASRHGNFPVKKGDKIAGTRIIPLTIEKTKMEEARTAAGGGPIMDILPIKEKKIGIVTTGSEVYYGLIEDQFTPLLIRKIEAYGSKVAAHRIVNDDTDMETEAIREMLAGGCDMILCTGGMSVDPDDRTPMAIRSCADRVISYGAPVLPGAMFMLAYQGQVPICGLPGCVMYAKHTIFDLILPRLLADDPITKEEIDGLGEGGLCLNCSVCTFPDCGFGKGF